MGDPITWYALPRTVVDLQTVTERIDANVLLHNQDPSAHGQSSESVYEHRIQPLLDHVQYSIYNIKNAFQARSIKAFVGPSGVADFEDIQEAIDYVELHGGGKVFAQAGTYNLTDSVVVPDNVELEGEGPGLTILNFTVAEKNLRSVGTPRTPAWVSYGIPQNSKTVTGVGTDFLTSVEAGDYIDLDSGWYKILSVDSDTVLTLEQNYRGRALVGLEDPAIIKFIENMGIFNLSVKGATGTGVTTASGIYIAYCTYFEVKDVVAKENAKFGIFLTYSFGGILNEVVGLDNTLSGFLIDSFFGGSIKDCQAYANAQSGFIIQSSRFLAGSFTDCLAYHNGDHGFNLNYAQFVTLHGCEAYRNQDHGFRLYGADFNRLLGIVSHYNGDDGVWLSGAPSTSDKNIVVADYVRLNTNGQIDDDGNNNVIDHNVVA